MPDDAGQQIVDTIKSGALSPVNAVKDQVTGVAEKAHNYFKKVETEGSEAIAALSQPSPEAQLRQAHDTTDAMATIQKYWTQHPEAASSNPALAKRLGIKIPPQPQQAQQATPGQNPSQLNPGQKEKTPAQWSQQQQAVEGTSGSEAEPAMVDPAQALLEPLTGPVGAGALGARVVGNLAGQAGAGYAQKAAGMVTNNPILQTAAGLLGGALAGHLATGAAGAVPLTKGEEISTPPPPTGDIAPRSVTPEAMYTTQAETPGRNVTPGADETVKALPQPEGGEAAGEAEATTPQGAPQGAAPATKEAQPAAESVGAAAYAPKRDIAEDMTVEHTWPDLIARARETPLKDEEATAFKLHTDTASGHETLEPVSFVDAIRLRHWTDTQTGQFADMIDQHAAAMKNGTYTPEMEKAFMKKMAFIRDEVVPRSEGADHQLGLGLNVLRSSPLTDMSKLMINQKALMQDGDTPAHELLSRLAQLKDTEQQTEMLKKAGQRGFWDHIATIFAATRLGPDTAFKKLSSDVMMTMYQPVERYGAAGVGAVRGALGGEPGVSLQEANDMLMATIRATWPGIKLGAESWKSNTPMYSQQMGFGEIHRPIGSAGTPLEGTWLGKMYDALGSMVNNLGTRHILFPDQSTGFIHQQAEQAALITAKAREMAAGLTGSDYTDAVAMNIEKLTAKVPTEIQEASRDYSQMQRFAAEMQGWVKKGIMQARRSPAGKLLLPFFPTPANIELRAMENSGTPIALLSKNFRDMMAQGGRNGDIAVSRLTLGFALSGAAAMLAMNGKMTGELPQKAWERKLAVEAGHQRNAFVFGNDKYEMGRLPAPLGTIFGTIADVVQIANKLPVDYSDPNHSVMLQRLDNVANAVTMGMAQHVMNEDFFKGISSVLQVVGNLGQGDIDRASARLDSLKGSLTPTVMSDLEQWWGGIAQEIGGEVRDIQADTPDKPIRDIWGNKVLIPLGSSAYTLGLINAFRTNKIQHDPVNDEMLRLEPNIPAEAPKAIAGPVRPGMGPDKPKYGVPLTWQEQDHFEVLRATMKDSNGDNLKQAMGRMMDGEEYKHATDSVKTDMIQQLFLGRHHMAIERLVHDSPSIQQRLQQRSAERAKMYGARPESIESMVAQ